MNLHALSSPHAFPFGCGDYRIQIETHSNASSCIKQSSCISILILSSVAQVKQPSLDVTLSSHDAATSPCRRAASHDPDRHDEQDAEDFRHHRLGMMMIGTPVEGQESKKSNQQEGEESWAGMVVAQMNKDLELCNSAKMEKEGAATRMLPFRPPGMPPMMQGRNEPDPRARERFKIEEKKRVMQKRQA